MFGKFAVAALAFGAVFYGMDTRLFGFEWADSTVAFIVGALALVASFLMDEETEVSEPSMFDRFDDYMWRERRRDRNRDSGSGDTTTTSNDRTCDPDQ